MFFLVLTAIAAVRARDLFVVVMLFGIYSFLSAGLFMTLDAVDVAFTEAAVGAGVSTVLMMASLRMATRHEKTYKHSPIIPLLVVSVTGAALVYGTLDAPLLGDPNAPAQTHVAPYYIEKTPEEIGVPNIVTAVLASYRGYDTLGETVVIFTAGLVVLLLLGINQGGSGGLAPKEGHVVLRVVAKGLIPFILMYGLYVQFHGDYGAGGGFQAGVIFASAFVLYHLVFGHAHAQRVVPVAHLHKIAALGVLLYGGVGVAGMLLGRNFLDYSALSGDPVAGQHLGILLVELGVGITVFAVVTTIYFAFAGREAKR